MTSEQSPSSKNLEYSPFFNKYFCHVFNFKHPTTVLIAGPTQAGKTEFVIKLLKEIDTLLQPNPERIIWAYGQKNEKQMEKIEQINPNIEFCEGFPSLDSIDSSKNNLLILDDLMDEIGKNSDCSNLFTRGSHHKNITVFAIIHNLFNQQKYSRTISLNARCYVLFNSPRDNQQIRYFGRQIFPHNPTLLPSALRQVCEVNPFGYLVVDLHSQTPETLRLHTGIFSNEIPRIFV